MGKEILTFGDIEIEKKNLPQQKSCPSKERRYLESISI